MAAVAPQRGLAWHVSLDGRRATLAYWAGVLLVAASMFVPRLLPCVDYPQHLALADVARRLSSPTAPEQLTHQLNYFTYNGLFHVLVARLGRVMPIELAGRTVVALSLVLLGGSVLSLLRTLRRPPEYAALATPILFGFALGWGFVNYALGSALAFATLVFVARSLQRPTWASLAFTALLGFTCALTHVLAMLVLCVFAASLAPEVAWRSVSGRSPARRAWAGALRSALALSPILVGATWCVAVYREQYAWSPGMYKDPTLEGTSPGVLQKVLHFGAWASGVHADHTDQALVAVTLGCCAIAGLEALRRRGRGLVAPPGEPCADDAPSLPVLLPMLAMSVAYLRTPMVFIGTHLIFPRLAQGVVIAALLAAPAASSPLRARLRRVALAVGVLAGLNLFAHTCVYAAETDDASRVIDDLPPNRRAAAVVYDADTWSFRHATLTHLAAYYGARRGGLWAFSFARYLSVPVRFRSGGEPWWPRYGWEFVPSDYNPRCKYARHFDLLLVRAPLGLDDEALVRNAVFGKDAARPKKLSRHGRFWAFDTAGLPDDGTY